MVMPYFASRMVMDSFLCRSEIASDLAFLKFNCDVSAVFKPLNNACQVPLAWPLMRLALRYYFVDRD